MVVFQVEQQAALSSVQLGAAPEQHAPELRLLRARPLFASADFPPLYVPLPLFFNTPPPFSFSRALFGCIDFSAFFRIRSPDVLRAPLYRASGPFLYIAAVPARTGLVRSGIGAAGALCPLTAVLLRSRNRPRECLARQAERGLIEHLRGSNPSRVPSTESPLADFGPFALGSAACGSQGRQFELHTASSLIFAKRHC